MYLMLSSALSICAKSPCWKQKQDYLKIITVVILVAVVVVVVVVVVAFFIDTKRSRLTNESCSTYTRANMYKKAGKW